jgi:hypothetical protein
LSSCFSRGNTFYRYNKRNKEGSATILGRAEIKGNKLILESNSRTRLEKGEKLVLEALSDAIIHRADTYQDPMEAIKSMEESSIEKPENELPLEIQQQVYTHFMQKHCEKWLKDKIPALAGRTPMQAVKTEEGKR